MSVGMETAQGEHPASLGTEQGQGEQHDQDTCPQMSSTDIAAITSSVVEILRQDSWNQESGSSNPAVAGSSSSSSTTVQGILVTYSLVWWLDSTWHGH